MQTIFRPHLQEASYYSEWLKDERRYKTVEIPITFGSKERNVRNDSSLSDMMQLLVELKESNSQISELIKQEINTSPDDEGLEKIEEITTELSVKVDEGIASMYADSNVDSDLLKVQVANTVGAVRLIRELRNHGYYTELYGGKKLLSNETESAAIWLGLQVPLEMAKSVLQTARKMWPHLCYVHLTGGRDGAPQEVNFEIFLGGATSTAQRYGCLPWSDDDFQKLEAISTRRELHKLVRSKESRRIRYSINH